MTGRIDIWREKIQLLGPLGYGYLPGITFDNNFLYATYLSGFLFSLPLFIFCLYACIKYLIGFYKSEENTNNYFEYTVKAPLIIYLLINLFLTQQTIGMTSIIGYFFNLVPLGIVSSDEAKT